MHFICLTGILSLNILTVSFSQDTRILSGWVLTVNGQCIKSTGYQKRRSLIGRCLLGGVPRLDGYADSPLIVERLREVGAGIKEQVTVFETTRRSLPNV